MTGVSTADYSAGKGLAPRPAMSSLSLQKLRSSGFEPEDALTELGRYLLAE